MVHVMPALCSSCLAVLFKVLWFTVLASTYLCCRVVCCSLQNHSVRLKQSRGDRMNEGESECRGERRQGKRESPGEVNGWNVRWGSENELHTGLGGTGGIVSRLQGSQWLWLTPKQHFMADDTVLKAVAGLYPPTAPRITTVSFYCEFRVTGLGVFLSSLGQNISCEESTRASQFWTSCR